MWNYVTTCQVVGAVGKDFMLGVALSYCLLDHDMCIVQLV
jgi:hypothetical protein